MSEFSELQSRVARLEELLQEKASKADLRKMARQLDRRMSQYFIGKKSSKENPWLTKEASRLLEEFLSEE